MANAGEKGFSVKSVILDAFEACTTEIQRLFCLNTLQTRADQNLSAQYIILEVLPTLISVESL